MNFANQILTKRGVRSDAAWTLKPLFSTFLRRIPILLDLWALNRSQFFSRAELAELRDARLRDLFQAAQKVPYWKMVMADLDVQTLAPVDVVRGLPVTDKHTLIEEIPENLQQRHLLPSSNPDHTSGSTGRPLHFYFDWHASLRSFAVTERIFRVAGKGKRYPIVYMRSRERNGFTPYHEWLYVRGFHGIAHRMQEIAALGAKYSQGFVLYGYASSVLEVAHQLEKNALHIPLCAVLATGERVTAAERAYIETVCKAPFYSVYASREAGYLGFECPEHSMHVNEEWAYLEIVDEKGLPLPDGVEGRVVVTTFDNQVMPFIRYDLGDRGILHNDPCPCGRTLKTITFRGRVAELIHLKDGRTVALLDITSALDRFWSAIKQFQVVQKSPERFVFKVVAGQTFDTDRTKLERLLRQLLHPEVVLEWEMVHELQEAPSGKAVYFVREF